MLHGKLVGKHSRGLPGQGKEQREGSEVLKTARSGWSREGLREERLKETGMEKSPGWTAKGTVCSREGFGFCPEDSGDQQRYQARKGRVRLAF